MGETERVACEFKVTLSILLLNGDAFGQSPGLVLVRTLDQSYIIYLRTANPKTTKL